MHTSLRVAPEQPAVPAAHGIHHQVETVSCEWPRLVLRMQETRRQSVGITCCGPQTRLPRHNITVTWAHLTEMSNDEGVGYPKSFCIFSQIALTLRPTTSPSILSLATHELGEKQSMIVVPFAQKWRQQEKSLYIFRHFNDLLDQLCHYFTWLGSFG